jgi:putative transposase
MKNLRRFHVDGATYFITCVTDKRAPILVEHADLLHRAIEHAREHLGFIVSAWSILPDHCHLLIEVGQTDISTIMHRIKQKFSSLYRSKYGLRRGRLWQNRFWDHVIRDQLDFNRHLDYIHYNPVRHGRTDDPFAYRESSLSDWFERGLYSPDWGVKERPEFSGDFGE